MLLYEVLTETELRRDSERFAREQRVNKLARLATQNRPSAIDTTWASAIAGLDRLVEKGLQAVRLAQRGGSSQPSEECC